MAHANNDKDHYSAKPSIFDGEKLEYWKDRIKSFFIGYDVDLWDIVIDGYTYPTNAYGTMFGRSKMNAQQKKDHKNQHRFITILLNVISYSEYEKIINKDFVKSIFNSLKMTHERNEQVKKTKAFALIHKYEAFKMEECFLVAFLFLIEEMLLGFQTLLVGLKVLNKGYTTSDHVNKIIRSSPKK